MLIRLVVLRALFSSYSLTPRPRSSAVRGYSFVKYLRFSVRQKSLDCVTRGFSKKNQKKRLRISESSKMRALS